MRFLSCVASTEPPKCDQALGIIHKEQRAEHLLLSLMGFVLCVAPTEPPKCDQALGIIHEKQRAEHLFA